MSFGPFTTHLIPFTKNGKLQFWNDITKEIIEADFSRPNIGGTSGSSVFRNNQLIDLDENEPDWDDYNGCPRLFMRSQSSNLCSQPLSVASASKVNVVIADNASIREDGDAASEFFAFQDFTGFTELTKYTLFIEVEPIGGRNFRLQEGLGSGAISNINFNTETANDGELRKQSNGKFILKLHLTTAASQTTIRFLMRILDASMGTNYDGEVNKGVNVTFRDIQLGHIGFDPIIGNVTRSANSFEFSDLINKSVITDNNFSLIVDLDNAEALGNSGFRFFLFQDLTARFAIYGMINGGMRVYDFFNSTYIGGSNPTDKEILLTVSGSVIKVYYPSSGLTFTQTSSAGSYNVNKMTGAAPNGFAEIKKIAFAPFVLSESQAIAELNKL